MLTTAALENRIRRELPRLPTDDVSELARAVHRRAEALQPEQIYVFGSQARGQATPESDVDLLVVVPHSDLPPHRRDQEAYRAMGKRRISVDVLVLTRSEFDQRSRAVSSLPATVLREGRVLYAA